MDPWCVKRRAVGFSEVSLRGVTRSAKPITTAYTLVSASTSLGLRIRLQVSQGIKPVLQVTSWVSNYVECWKWLFNKVNVAKPVKIEQSGLSSEPSITGLSTKIWNRLNFLEAYNHLKWKCFMTLGPVILGRLNWFRRCTLFLRMLSGWCICFGSCDVRRRNQRRCTAVIPDWARHEKRLSRSKFN